LSQLIHRRVQPPASLAGELLPLLRRYAVSWLSGYVIFQSLAPIAFRLLGPAEAGKVGLSLAAFTALYNLAFVLVVVKVPRINILVAQGQPAQADATCRRQALLACAALLVANFGFYAFLFAIRDTYPLQERLVGMSGLLLLSAAGFMQVVVSAWAIFIRAHKAEPLAGVSLAWAAIGASATVAAALMLPPAWYFAGYMASYVLVLPFFHRIYSRYRAAPPT
jgi:hypothetical protein